MSQEWLPLIATGLVALYALWTLFKIMWDKHVFEEKERERRDYRHQQLQNRRSRS